MKIRNFEDLNLQEVDTMREISSIGTSHAATALSKFLQKEIRITLPRSVSWDMRMRWTASATLRKWWRPHW